MAFVILTGENARYVYILKRLKSLLIFFGRSEPIAKPRPNLFSNVNYFFRDNFHGLDNFIGNTFRGFLNFIPQGYGSFPGFLECYFDLVKGSL